MLSNTSLICPLVIDNFGKLRVNNNRGYYLEWYFSETRAKGWGGGWLGSWWCNGPPSPWSIRALREVARRGTLRNWSQPYGVQQARNLYNARKCDKGILSAHATHGLLSRVNILMNKWWVRLVPAAAVTPAPRVATTFIGPKASVAGSINFLWNRQAQLDGALETLSYLRPGGVRGIPRGAVKCDNPWRITYGEGIWPERIWRWGTKARGAIRIRYPSSPSSKRCELDVAHLKRICSVDRKLLSSPPGKYGRKTETLRNWRGSTTRGAACGLI